MKILRCTVYELWDDDNRIVEVFRIEARKEMGSMSGKPWCVVDSDGDIRSVHGSEADATAAAASLLIAIQTQARQRS